MVYLPREEGQGLAEYGLVLVLIAVVVFLVVALLGPYIGNLYSSVMAAI